MAIVVAWPKPVATAPLAGSSEATATVNSTATMYGSTRNRDIGAVQLGVVPGDVALHQLDRRGHADVALLDLGQPAVVGPQLEQGVVDGGVRGEQARRGVDRHVDAEVLELGERQPRRLAAGDLVEQQR